MKLEDQTNTLLDAIVEQGVCEDRDAALRYCVEHTWLMLKVQGDESEADHAEIRRRLESLDRGEGIVVEDLDAHFEGIWERAVEKHTAKQAS